MVSSMTSAQFASELLKARKGAAVAYHVGLLMADRNYNVEVDAVARAAWQAHLDRKVVLIQRRVKSGACQYIAWVL